MDWTAETLLNLWRRRRRRRSIRNWDFPSPAVRVRECSQHSSSIDHADGMGSNVDG